MQTATSDSVMEALSFRPFLIIDSKRVRIGYSTIAQPRIRKNEIETVGIHSKIIDEGLSYMNP
jgi:hypothetical protein